MADMARRTTTTPPPEDFEEHILDIDVAEQMKSKMRPAQGGAGAMAMVAKGEVEIGLTFVSEITSEPGVESVGALPRSISPPTSLVGFVSALAKSADLARALLTYLSGPEAAAIYKARGMQPGR
jgi:molybdate transport system substrate-binding protein